jgi:Fe-S-cluster containining protein
MDKFAEACLRMVDSGRCAGECCGCIPIDRDVVDANRFEMQVGYTEMIPAGELSYPMTDDMACVFLHRMEIRCMIYDQRPDVCRRFGDESHSALFCPYLHADGTERTRSERREVRRSHKMNWELLSKARKEKR